MKEKDQYISLNLRKRNFGGLETSSKVEDILEYKNLKKCSFFRFMIEEKDIGFINQVPNLNFIYFDFCYFALERLVFNVNIEEIVFNLCENLKIKHLSNIRVKRMKILHLKESNIVLDLSEIENAENLEELSIHNCRVKGIEKILEKAPRIKKINLDGSIIDNQSYLMELKKVINVTNEKEFNYANA